ncbi:MAG: type III pantothenate kinase [Candidatus Cloacimonadota bacterium]|nr:MAG: type III pantothenate kinase [Candidatus Cloacimonadota bacterium]
MSKSRFVVDIGNTHIVMGIYRDNSLVHSWRIGTDYAKTEDEYFSIIKILSQEGAVDFAEISIAAIASVVPELTRVFSHLVKKYLKCPLIVVTAKTDLGLSFPMKNPEFIGADLLVNAFAAKEIYRENCIVCDFGTATTIQLVGADGFFYGTVISPGVITSAANLFKKASLLSNVELKPPQKVLGTSTEDALLSGILSGNTFMIDGFISAIRDEYKHLGTIKAVATGGIAGLICQNSRKIDLINKNLTLDGLNLICQRHHE